MNSSAWGIIIANGKGETFSVDVDTAFLNIGSKPILAYSLIAYEQCRDIDGIVVVAPKERLENIQSFLQVFGCSKVRKVVAGSSHRLASVLNGLAAVDEDVTFISIHDAARPAVRPEQIAETIKAAKKHGCGILASPIQGGVKEAKKNMVVQTLDQSTLWQAHSPQAFKRSILEKALSAAQKKKIDLIDESASLELIKEDVCLVPTDRPVVRVAGPLDLNIADLIMRQ